MTHTGEVILLDELRKVLMQGTPHLSWHQARYQGVVYDRSWTERNVIRGCSKGVPCPPSVGGLSNLLKNPLQ